MISNISNQVSFKAISMNELESRLTMDNIKGYPAQPAQTYNQAPIASSRFAPYESDSKKDNSHTGLYLGILALAAAVAGFGYAAHNSKIKGEIGEKLKGLTDTCISKTKEWYHIAEDKFTELRSKIGKKD